MKYLFALVLSGLLWTIAAPVQADEYRVTANRLNVRELPIPGYNIVGQVVKGDILKQSIVSGVHGADWLAIIMENGETGFVSSRYVERVRIDPYAADHLQLLPKTPVEMLFQGFAFFQDTGLRLQRRFSLTASGSHIIIQDTGAVHIYDVKLQRVTRKIATHDFAVTNNFLIYRPALELSALPHLEVIDLRISDTVQMIDPRGHGGDRFIGLAPVANTDRILTQIDHQNGFDLVELDLSRQQVTRRLLTNHRDDAGHLGLDLFAVGAEAIVGFRQADQFAGNQAHIYLAHPAIGQVMTTALGDIKFGEMVNAYLYPDQKVAVLMGRPADGNWDENLAVAIDTETGRILWQDVSQGHQEALVPNAAGVLVRYKNRFSSDRTERVIDLRTGVLGPPRPDKPVYGFKDQTWQFMANDQTTQLSLTAGLDSQIETALGARISRPGQELHTFEFANLRSNMADFLPDGETFRLLVGDEKHQSYFEWNLTEPEPRRAVSVDPAVRWISEPAEDNRVGVLFSEGRGYSRTTLGTVMGLGDTRPKDDGSTQGNCDQDRTDFGATSNSDQGQLASMNDHGCLWHWDRDTAVFTSLPSPSRLIPHEETLQNPTGCTSQKGCLTQTGINPVIGPNLSRVGQAPHSHWTTWLDQGHQQQATLVTYDFAAGSVLGSWPVPMGRVVDMFATPNENFENYVPAPQLHPLRLGNDGLSFMVHGQRRGDKSADFWLFELAPDGGFWADPKRLLPSLQDKSLFNRVYFNGTHYVFDLDHSGVEDQHMLVFARADGTEIARQFYTPGGERFDEQIRHIGRDHFVNALSPTTYQVYTLKNGALAATLVVDATGNALAISPGGYFAQNQNAASELMVVRNRDTGEALPINAVFDTLYRPDLIQEALLGDPDNRVGQAESALSLAKVMGGGGAPVVRELQHATSVVANSVNAEVTVQLGSGGLGNIIWRVNGVTVGVDETQSAPFANNAGQQATATRQLPLEMGKNVISVQVTNHNGTIYSESFSRVVHRDGPAETDIGRLFVLAVGVDDYDAQALKLNHSVNDARAVANLLSQSGAGYDDVRVATLFDKDVTAAALDQKFQQIAGQIRPSDTFVFFLAGHGVTHNGSYYFLPPNIDVGAEPAVALATYGISQNDWRRMFSQISALKSLILFDSCESGSAIRMNAANSLEQGAGISKLAQASGRAIITAAAETQYALEGHAGHGAFTYTLLEAFAKGDANNNSRLGLDELAVYVAKALPDLTEGTWQYRQEPQIKIEGDAFEIGQTVAAQ